MFFSCSCKIVLSLPKFPLKKRFKILYQSIKKICIFESSNNKTMTRIAIIKKQLHTGETLVRFSDNIKKSEQWVEKTNNSNADFGIDTRFRIAYNENDKFFTGAAQ